MAGAARATREAAVHFMGVEEMDVIRLWKNGGRGVDHPLLFTTGLHILRLNMKNNSEMFPSTSSWMD